ncbi:MAG TPA: hypothetical protein VN886_17890 [Acidimicrobiales bacterium]|nr:hypothetical protein [Acidimicrobiales bacterium]
MQEPLFQINAHGDIWQEPQLGDPPLPGDPTPAGIDAGAVARIAESRALSESAPARTTYRQRRDAKAERLRSWAEKRQRTAAAVFEANKPFTTDHAFNTQPGHIPLRARIVAQEDRHHESLRKAAEMASRADGIESAAAHAIYSDDPDAVERLTERIALLEAERDRVKRFNAACREAGQVTAAALEVLTPAEREHYAGTAHTCSAFLGKAGQMPAYVLQNLAGNITRQRQRLAQLEREIEARAGTVEAETERDDGGTHRVTSTREEIEYPGKPSAEVRTAIKAQGYRWDRVAGCWWRRRQAAGHAPDIDIVNGY